MTTIRLFGLAAAAAAAALAGCAQVAAPQGHAPLDSGLSQTGSAGVRGGAAAAPAGAGAILTTRP